VGGAAIDERAVFVADIHLRPDRPDRTDRFFRFLAGRRAAGGTVYILGDLFDVWVSPRQVSHPRYRPLVERIRQAVEGGLRIVFVQGNRDFLIDERFARATGVKVHEDPADAVIGGRKVLLTHGDLLCSADRAYQRTRRILRSRWCRRLAAALPVSLVFALASGLRRYSDRAVSRKRDSTLEPTEAAVLRYGESGYETIVCGHLHRPRKQWYSSGTRRCLLVCVGDWEEGGSFAEVEGGELDVRALDGDRDVVTIDGPSGAGKSTVARLLAERLGWSYLDTGAMYRAVAWKVLELGIEPEDRQRVEEVAAAIDLGWSGSGGPSVDGRDVSREIRTREVTAAVSPVSAHPGVRREMVKRQRDAARTGRIVVEGRDIGSVVFPDARFRFYLDATPGERARRRARELEERGSVVQEEEVRADLEARDRYDSSRQDSPLRFEEGMEYVDTSDRTVEEVVDLLARKVLAS
jgi:cytidylate kinase/UDP-2,3-diacylglucosamine diphosphatase